jgi:hypothetical protein
MITYGISNLLQINYLSEIIKQVFVVPRILTFFSGGKKQERTIYLQPLPLTFMTNSTTSEFYWDGINRKIMAEAGIFGSIFLQA